jgi:diaminohydroxyphosphoribosylaminopyrimidine deaminase / 5-amino-6-(5-phosphoribosylamino)uracil reductase
LYAPLIIGDDGTPLVRGYGLGSWAEAPILQNVAIQLLGKDLLLKAIVQR